MSSAEIVVRMSATDARTITDRIKVGVEACWELITQAYVQRAWDALGYSSWDDYCTREFGTSRLRLPREERQEVVSSLRESGLSLRAIASATQTSINTVQKDLDQVYHIDTPDEDAASDDLAEELIADVVEPDRESAPVIGIDGKRYQPARPAPKPSEEPATPRRRALVDSAREIGLDLKNITARIERLLADDRFARNKSEVAPHLRFHLTQVIKVCQDLNQQINQGESA